MSIAIKVPAMGESVTEATIARWLKREGEAVRQDEPLVELETDKVNVEVPSPAAGVLEHIEVQQGGTVSVGSVLGQVAEGKAGAVAAKTEAKAKAPAKPAAPAKPTAPAEPGAPSAPPPPPSVRRIAEEERIDASKIAGSGKRGQVTKGDALEAVAARAKAPAAEPVSLAAVAPVPRTQEMREERVPMSRLRRTIAMRLKESQEIAAQLTTFNEADMWQIMSLRTTYRDSFEKKHGVRLGFMGFFVKACIAALKEIPAVNAEIDGDDIVYKHFYDIGVAVSTERGLVVPVLRDADALSLADIEKRIAELGTNARSNKLKLEDLLGGTFTITNGGVFGSLMSTPILNMPQTGILGMHKIQNRPMAIGDKVEIRPMMYLALSYDHRLVDGREAVTFLVRVKENLEDPQRLLLDL
ncbi:MAG TPA: 2-oxoglutarate dehydrogenase complex dihydrolipoyllysine-residue succinyltransferase [Micropepsaceae bacterium]|nr:2-oxoglutarate dehydrogenase complex dihydrolipoyllysine-residue succinyltransferase [Micropepsaceae bacterium]